MVLAPVGAAAHGPAVATIGRLPAMVAAMAATIAGVVTTVAAMGVAAMDTVGARPAQWL